MKKIISLLAILFLLTACKSKYEVIDTNKALTLIENGAIIIDVRTEEEYIGGHITDAINIPLDRIDSITYDKDKTLVLYCATGIRSATAAEQLYDMGYTSLYSLDGGLINWGEPLEE